MVVHQIQIAKINLTKYLIFAPFFILLSFTIASIFLLTSPPSSALDSAVTRTVIKVSDACSISKNSTSTDHAAVMAGGTTNSSVGTSIIDVLCNDHDGYSVYAKGVLRDGVTPSTDLIGINNGQTIPTGLDMSTNVSNWAMRLSTEDYTDAATYYTPTILSDNLGSFALNHTIPSTDTKVVTYTSDMNSTNNNDKPSRFASTYAVAISPYQLADTYKGHVKYTLVHPNYADSNNKVYMQDLTPDTIAKLLPAIGSTFETYDKRDDQKYTIAKLADGKYWMTTNLNLAGGTPLYSNTSNVPSGYDEADGIPYFTLPASEQKQEDSHNLVNANAFSDGSIAYVFNSRNTTDCGASGQNIPCDSYYSWIAATAGGKDSSGDDVTDNGHNAAYSICPKGWRLLTTGIYDDNSESSIAGYKKGDMYLLATSYGANLDSQRQEYTDKFYNEAGPGTIPNFRLNGQYINGAFYADAGIYWTATFTLRDNQDNYAYEFSFADYFVDAAFTLPSYRGFSVRCIFEDRDLSDITYMQDISE